MIATPTVAPGCVVAGAPPEHLSAAFKLVCKGFPILKYFSFQRGVKRLRKRIIGTGSHRPHRLGDTKVSAGFLELIRGIHTAVVGMKHRSCKASTGGACIVQGLNHKRGFHMIRDSKAHKPARTTIQYCRQIHVRPVSNRQVSDVRGHKVC